MKFCKNLQRVVDISDPEWAPYWTNYKMLKKLIKELPSLVPAEDGSKASKARSQASEKNADSPESLQIPASSQTAGQQRGDETSESKVEASVEAESPGVKEQRKEELGKSPGEIAFFKLLHAELKKTTHFFEKAQEEFIIREERVREGMEIMKRPNSIMVNEKWSMLAKSLFKLYKDLLLLETFAIMTYCSFSKILKKHDKVTGYQTRSAFMDNVVSKANFTSYPAVLQMISRCERMYEEVSERLMQEGKEGLYEDERLFINMISRLNEQALQNDDAPDAEARRPANGMALPAPPDQQQQKLESPAVSTLRSLVEENEARAIAAMVSEGHTGDDHQELGDRKRAADESKPAAKKRAADESKQAAEGAKRPRSE